MSKSPDFSLADRRSANRAFDFIDRIRKIATVNELRDAFTAEANAFGFQHFAIARIMPKSNILHKNMLLHAWPDEWYQRYDKQGYMLLDPVARAVDLNILPFTWRDVRDGAVIPGTDPRIFDEAQAWQMHEGFCVPVRSLDGLRAIITLSGETLELSASTRGALHLIAIYSHAKALELCDEPLRKICLSPRLTPRECECTIWIAAGKSTWDTSQILGLSELTIAVYIKSAMRKLNVVTRAQLVAEALRLGEINL